MEDKELQEMFDAKRTVEANRRRQEALRQMVEARAAEEAKPRVRRLWPVWTGAAAACIAALVFTLPALFGSEEATPVLVAEAEVPEVVIPQAAPTEAPEATILPKKRQTPGTLRPTEAAPQAQPLSEEAATTTTPAVEETPAVEAPVEPTVPATPRVLRRTSSLIACTEGCTVPEDSRGKSSRDIEFNFFAQSNSTDNIIYSFEINK